MALDENIQALVTSIDKLVVELEKIFITFSAKSPPILSEVDKLGEKAQELALIDKYGKKQVDGWKKEIALEKTIT